MAGADQQRITRQPGRSGPLMPANGSAEGDAKKRIDIPVRVETTPSGFIDDQREDNGERADVSL
jgi:hypothetical protein